MTTLARQPAALDLVRTVRCSDGLVTLDVERDLYLSLYDPRSDDGGPDIALGYPPAPARRRDWQDIALPPVRPTLRDIVRFVRVIIASQPALRRLPFAALLEDARYRQSRRGLTRDPAAILRTTALFERLRRWLPGKPLCLARSYLLLRFLAAYGQRADWIFGVSLFPFAAHCWVASGPTVLGDRADLLQRFSIILTLDGEYL